MALYPGKKISIDVSLTSDQYIAIAKHFPNCEVLKSISQDVNGALFIIRCIDCGGQIEISENKLINSSQLEVDNIAVRYKSEHLNSCKLNPNYKYPAPKMTTDNPGSGLLGSITQAASSLAFAAGNSISKLMGSTGAATPVNQQFQSTAYQQSMQGLGNTISNATTVTSSAYYVPANTTVFPTYTYPSYPVNSSIDISTLTEEIKNLMKMQRDLVYELRRAQIEIIKVRDEMSELKTRMSAGISKPADEIYNKMSQFVA